MTKAILRDKNGQLFRGGEVKDVGIGFAVECSARLYFDRKL